MKDDFSSGLLGVIGGVAILGAVLIFGLFALLAAPFLIGWYMWYTSPSRKERLAQERTQALYKAATRKAGLRGPDPTTYFDHYWPSDLPPTVKEQLLAVAQDVYNAEDIVDYIPPPPALCNSIEGARYRDKLMRIERVRGDRDVGISAAKIISQALAPLTEYVPRIESDIHIPIVANIPTLGETVEQTIMPFFEPNEYNHFKELRKRLDQNFDATHRSDPIHPRDYKEADLVDVYLKGTPLRSLFDIRVPFAIPEKMKYEHTYMLAGSGAGKTTAMKRMIAKEMVEVADGQKSVVVIESKGTFIRELLNTDFPEDRLVYINAEDPEHPPAMNLFAAAGERLGQFSAREQTQLRNSIVELYEYVLAAIMDAGMTAQQRAIFRYAIRLLLVVPDADLMTLLDLLEKDGEKRYQEYIAQLDELSQRFFASQFNDKDFDRTRKAVHRRLYILLENDTFRRMFCQPACKFNLFDAINDGKLILVNTSKGTLSREGSIALGRLFIALTSQAAAERSIINPSHKTPTLLFIDEAHEYIQRDQNIADILAQAREQRIGLMVAHQELNQIKSADVQGGLLGNTSTKMCARLSYYDAQKLSNEMRCETRELTNNRTFEFMVHVRGVTHRALPISYQPGGIEDYWQEREDMAGMLERQRRLYGVSAAPKAAPEPPPEDPPEEEEEKAAPW